jgi:hypothetical protein
MIHTPTDSIMRAFASPAFARAAAQPSFIGTRRPALGQTFDQMLGLPPWTGDVLRLAVHGSTGALGIYIGTLGRGFWSTLGWVVGIVSGFAAVLDIASLVGRLCGKE